MLAWRGDFVSYSDLWWLTLRCAGSNCVLIERGEVPIYEQCYGCSMREAFACLQDMRNNITGNVPPVSSLHTEVVFLCCCIHICPALLCSAVLRGATSRRFLRSPTPPAARSS